MKENLKGIFYAIVIISLVLGLCAVVPALLMVAWNLSIPHIFDLPEITFWQSVGITIVLGVISMVMSVGGSNETQ